VFYVIYAYRFSLPCSRNFDGKFLVDRFGNAYAVNEEELEDKIIELLNKPSEL
jgi:hypothetical protein